ncbi:MAG: sulfatase-like hydrolase/transferase, partial [Planctomycetes bacterium]|nr:sulfatase-like hydrolase/transferase [Planctomycetota bacterium]
MKRYVVLSALVISLVIAALGGHGLASDRPNLLVIFTDDHGYADLGCQGVLDDIRTPHIDRLASGGVRMTSGYVTAPQCVPSRAGLLTGRYQNRFGVESNGEALGGFDAELTIAERLKKAGYATGMTGKWHLGPAPAIARHGFDDVYSKNANGPGWANFDLDGDDRAPGAESSSLYHIDACSAAACAFIERHRSEPFFFYCAYRAPHVPLDAPPEYLRRFPGAMPERRRQALAMISAVDDGVGRIVAALREHGLEERTLVFFMGDNGAPLKIHKIDAPGGGPGWDGSLNDPLCGEKGMLAEGGIRVPFVVCWKGTIPGGQRYDHPVISLDVAATALALAGLPEDPRLDGVNLLPYLRGETQGAPHEALYWRWIAQSAVREGRWKYLRGGTREYLFDLEEDREEKHNLLAAHPDIAQRLKTKLARWAGELDPPGLATQKMAAVWERYFDHYLDGKPIAAPSSNPAQAGGRPTGAEERPIPGPSSDPRPAAGKPAALEGASTSPPSPDPSPAGGKPNVVFILADDLGWADTALYGHTKFYRTPNVERLARRGMTFTRAYSASPLCSPTRASILTGLSPARTGITTPACHLPQVVLEAAEGKSAPPAMKAVSPSTVTRLKTEYYTLAERLQDAGYATGHFGKWHLGHEPYSPLEHGFDVDVPHWPGPG